MFKIDLETVDNVSMQVFYRLLNCGKFNVVFSCKENIYTLIGNDNTLDEKGKPTPWESRENEDIIILRIVAKRLGLDPF